MRRPGVVCPRQALLDQIWGTHDVGDGASLDVLMSRIRRKLAEEGLGRHVQTRRGQGYCFDARTRPRPVLTDQAAG